MYHFIYPSKDTYIYELNTNSEKNFGGDDKLVLKKDFDGLTGLNGVSRVLLQFDLTELSKSIVATDIPTDATYHLKLYEQKTSELSPEYILTTFPLSQSWEEGTGTFDENPNKRDGVSWEKRNENLDNTTWNDISAAVSSGSRTTGGGVWYIQAAVPCSQSFSYQSPDVNMDISRIVNYWLDGTFENNGLILTWSGSQEDSTNHSGDISFFSSNANSIYSPKIEVVWDGHTTIGDTGLTQLTIDGTEDNYLYMINLRKEYKETETPRFRVGGRKRYQTKSVSTTKSTTKPNYVPEGSGSYSIVDVESGLTIVPFGSNSLFSSDSGSNYFKQDLRGFINNRKYKIKLKLKTDDGNERIFDDGFEFKVVK